MNHTPNYNLSQWAKSDRVLMDDFNADNAKIDAALVGFTAALTQKGNCRIVTGQYTGSGQCGSSTPNTLTFDKKPMFLLVHGANFLMLLARDHSIGRVLGSSSSTTCFWGNTSVSWYIDNIDREAWMQLNESGRVYTYIAFLEL